jgi:1-phosphatidylinositol-3-phosphate 5-kinase
MKDLSGEDDTVWSTENEDEMADKLLTQFPAYGTNEPNLDNWIAPSDNVEDMMTAMKASQSTSKRPTSININNANSTDANVNSNANARMKPSWDPKEESLWKGSSLSGNNDDNAAPTTTKWATPNSKSGSSETPPPIRMITGNRNKEHWMPDQLCKQCYDCDSHFTVFRRRHHCRLCGQVFCSSCSAYFVELIDEGKTTSRACRECFEQYEKSSIKEMDEKAAALGAAATTEAAVVQQTLPQHKNQTLLEPMVPRVESRTRLAEETAAAAASASTIKPEESSDSSNLGATAASHLERLGKALLASDAPILWNSLIDKKQKATWVNQLMTLTTKCCATVNPHVKSGDSLDIRPYVKIKSIAGGSVRDCAYMSGVIFRKSVAHKRMAKEVVHPRILLLSGGIEFTRTENRIASLEILLEQEDKYTEILVGKILKLQPDLVMVGRSVSRKAQELLLKADVVLLQHVKQHLMQRIARQTGASIISSTDHVMNQFGPKVLGKCHRFRLVSFRDNEVWMDSELEASDGGRPVKSIPALLKEPRLSNHERQAALAAEQLGEDVLDGSQAVKIGLAKRGVALSYVMLEGCPKNLGCTVVLRGANTVALKQVKRVLRFLVNVAYNLRLETCYLRERCAMLPSTYRVHSRNLFSSSLCVDYGQPPPGRKVRPWNGGSQQDTSISGETTALDHQSILITSVWMTDKTQCCPAEVKGICYYSLQDVSLGQFLRDSCFNLSLKCQNPNCKKSVLDHNLSFIHNDGLINISVEHMDDPLPPAPIDQTGASSSTSRSNGNNAPNHHGEENSKDESPIATWSFCINCKKVVTPLVYISEDTWKFSFGKFLESFFYNRDCHMNSSDHRCCCSMQTSAVLYFGCGRLAARFTYERVQPFGVFVGRTLPIDETYHRTESIRQLEQISVASSELFVKFDQHIEKVSREARSLFGSAMNRPEHLQTVLSQLNMIGSEVDHAAKTLQEKIASVSDKCQSNGSIVQEALFRFPWYSRRYLFMLTTAWNERLTAAGQALAAMKKLAESRSALRGDIIGPSMGDGSTEDLMEGMKRLRVLNEVYSQHNITDIGTMITTLPGAGGRMMEVDDDDFEDPESADFSDSVDADVLASRRRLNTTRQSSSDSLASGRDTTYPRKSLGAAPLDGRSSDVGSPNSGLQKNKTVTPGGAVKSALTRFFNRGGKESDPYEVDLGLFKEGRPRLEPGVDGIIIPVFDEIPSTVIAYSLSSTEYSKQMAHFSKMESRSSADDKPPSQDNKSSGAVLGGSDPGPVPTLKSTSKDGTPQRTKSSSTVGTIAPYDERKDIERRMLERNKSHIKHTFRDFDEGSQQTCKFVCTTYWATQFHAVRQAFLGPNDGVQGNSLDVEKGYIQSLSAAYAWAASGGKSGASFSRTADQRFVIKCISRTELQMFLDCAPAYFEYLSKAFFHGLPTVLCKIVGVYQIGYHNRETGKRSMDQVAVMQNIFYGRKISKTFDLKGSLRGRFARHLRSNQNKESAEQSEANATARMDSESDDEEGDTPAVNHDATLLDGDFLEFTNGRPLPLSDRAKAIFQMSVLNDTLFLSIINVLDYSILVGIDEEKMELVVGIIDFMRQYDIMKQMERVGKSLPMVVGSEAPTIIQPPLYKARFTNAMERYFMTVPSKWTTI